MMRLTDQFLELVTSKGSHRRKAKSLNYFPKLRMDIKYRLNFYLALKNIHLAATIKTSKLNCVI